MCRPEEFGVACAFFCAGSAGYITQLNLKPDSGAYPGLV